jgi:hypothetical protein
MVKILGSAGYWITSSIHFDFFFTVVNLSIGFPIIHWIWAKWIWVQLGRMRIGDQSVGFGFGQAISPTTGICGRWRASERRLGQRLHLGQGQDRKASFQVNKDLTPFHQLHGK